MLNRRTIAAVGLSSILSLATMAPAVADQDRGTRHDPRNSSQTTTFYLKTHHRQNYRDRDRDHRHHRNQHRRSHRGNYWYREHHGHYRHYPRGHDHDFANGLIFGGVLGYIIGNDY